MTHLSAQHKNVISSCSDIKSSATDSI